MWLIVEKNGDSVSPLQTGYINDWVVNLQVKGPSVTLSVLSECHHHVKIVKLHGLKLILLYYL